MFMGKCSLYALYEDTSFLFLNGSKSAMDIIALTETSENDDHSFLQNVKLEGYSDPFSTPTLTSKGGVAIYVNSESKTHERTDLKIQRK